MNRFIIPLGLLVMAAILYGTLAGMEEHTPSPDAAVQDLALAPIIDAAPVRDAFVSRIDAAPLPPPATAFEALDRYGVFGRSTEDLDRFLKRGGFERLVEAPEGARAYRDHGTVLTLRIEGGLITGMRADFDDNAASASLTALSWVICNERDHIRLHWGFEEPGDTLITGSFPQDDGRKIYYRGMVRASGEAPYGPTYIEMSPRPFQ